MKKKLLLTCTDLMAVQFLIPHVKYLSENGYDVTVACSDVGGRVDELREKLGETAKVRTVRLVRSPFSPQNFKGYGDVKRIINGEKWDIIWTNEPVMGVVTRLAAKKARRGGTRVVYMVHGFHFYRGAPALNWMLYYPVEKYCSRLCDVIATINEEDYRRAGKFHAGRVEKLPGVGVNLDNYFPNENRRALMRENLGIAENEIALLTVGELHKGKNQSFVIQAMTKMKCRSVKYFLCGKGETEQQLKKLIHDSGLDGRVELLGYRRDIPDIMRACDIFVFPSLREGLSKALMEAMASAMPVVCSDIRGNTDLIENGRGGFAANLADAQAFADALDRLCGDRKLRNEMGLYNCGAVEEFKEEKSLKENLSLLNSL